MRGMKTIRGSVDVQVNENPVQKLIFNYESPDRTRGWEIQGAWIWISDVKPNYTWNSDFNGLVYASLATDSIPPKATNKETKNAVTDPDDNRNVAWHQKQWLGKATEDILMPTASPGLSAC